ncbi:MAG: hypothetical protein JKX72_05510, partial [Robiginitomaculum sp.]|nr:hypothetical protein [Robiginitomaculum sp.]
IAALPDSNRVPMNDGQGFAEIGTQLFDREFISVPNVTSQDKIDACARGTATSLREITSFKRDEANRVRTGKAPETRSFCLKNIQNWTDSNKDKYLDPIFDSMPYLAK